MCRQPASDARRLDRAQKLLEPHRGVADALAELMDDLQGLLVFADLHQLADVVFAGLKRAQQLGKILARAVEILDRGLGRGAQLAPAIDEILLLFRLEACLSVERFELLVGKAESLGTKPGNLAIVRNRIE